MFLALVLSSLVLSAAPLGAIDNARLLRNPDIFAGRIVFQYGGDLWTCSASGGQAVQLTSHPGLESSPCFSPDGRWVAFSGQYDENMDVYIVPVSQPTPAHILGRPLFWGLFSILGGICAIFHGFCSCIGNRR